MINYRYILFDWDGTLVQTYQAWEKAYMEVFDMYHLHPTHQELFSKVVGRLDGPVAVGLPEEKIHEFNQKLVEHANNYIPETKLYPHAKELLQKLKHQNLNLALVTSSSRSLVQQRLSDLQLDHLFSAVITQNDVQELKPSPEPLHKAIQVLRAIPSKTIMIGDTAHDLDAAQNAGIDSILFYPKDHEYRYNLEDLKKSNPTHIVNSLDQIIELLIGKN